MQNCATEWAEVSYPCKVLGSQCRYVNISGEHGWIDFLFNIVLHFNYVAVINLLHVHLTFSEIKIDNRASRLVYMTNEGVFSTSESFTISPKSEFGV